MGGGRRLLASVLILVTPPRLAEPQSGWNTGLAESLQGAPAGLRLEGQGLREAEGPGASRTCALSRGQVPGTAWCRGS